MYEIVFFVIGLLTSWVLRFCYNWKQSKIPDCKDHPLISDTHMGMAQPGDIIVMIGSDDLYSNKNILTSLQEMCDHLKEKGVEIVLVPESMIKQAWIIPRNEFLPKQGDHSRDSSNDRCASSNII